MSSITRGDPFDVRPRAYFAACMVALYGLAFLRYFGAMLSHEPAFEEGPNLFYFAYYESLWHNLWATDCGYLTSLPRLFSVVLVKVLGMREHFFLAIHLIGPAIVAFMSSIFVLAPFRRVVRSDEARLVLALGCGSEMAMGVGSYNLWFFNIAYFGAAWPLLMLCLDHDRLSRKAFGFLTAFTVLLLTSKPYFITYLPLYALFTLHGMRVNHRRATLFAAVGVGAMLVQVGVMYAHLADVPRTPGGPLAGYGGRAFLTDELLSFLSTYLGVFLNQQILPVNRTFVYALYVTAAVLVVGLAWVLWKRSRPMFWFFVGANAVAAASLAVSLLGARELSAELDRNISWGRLAHLAPIRHYAFSNILITFGTLACLVRLMRGRQAQVAAALLLCLVIFNAHHYYSLEGDPKTIFKDWGEHEQERWSQWTRYCHLTEEQDCLIPVFPYWWAIKRGNDYLDLSPEDERDDRLITEVGLNSQQQARWQLRGVVIARQLRPDSTRPDPDDASLRAVAYDAAGNRLGVAAMLSPPGADFVYLLFPRKLDRVARLAFVDEQDRPHPVVSRICYFGSESSPPSPAQRP